MEDRWPELIPRRRIAVTGLGLVSSLGNNVLSAWNNLIEGGTGVRDISESHLKGYTDVMLTRLGAPVVGFSLMDNPEFNARRKRDEEDELYDLYDGEQNLRKEQKNFHLSHEYGLEAAHQGLGPGETGANILLPGSLIIDPRIVPHERSGVIMGTGIAGAAHMIEIQKKIDAEVRRELGKAEEGDDDIERVKAHDMQIVLTGRTAEIISMVFKTKAFAKSNLGECAASTDAIVEAADKIISGRADLVVAGGVEAAMRPATILAFERHMGAVSPSKNPEISPSPLDKNRDGFVFGEGGAVVVLEELEHARARGATIYAELIGWGDSADGHDPILPNEDGIQRSFDQCFVMAGMRPSELERTYPNLHAPGTGADPTEVKVATRNIKPKQTVGINSTKGSNGHALGSAGTTESIFTILSTYFDRVPPARNMTDPVDQLDGYDPVMGKRYKEVEVLYGLKMSSGFGGHNATLLFRKARI